MTKIPSLKSPTVKEKILTVKSFRKKKDGEYHIKGFHSGEAILSEDVLEKLSAKKNLVIHIGKNLTLNLGDITKDLLLSISGHGKIKVHEQTNAHIRTSSHIKVEMASQKGGYNTISDKSKWHIGRQYDGYNFVAEIDGAHLDVEEKHGGENYYCRKAKSMQEVLGKDAILAPKMKRRTIAYIGLCPEPIREGITALKKAISNSHKKEG